MRGFVVGSVVVVVLGAGLAAPAAAETTYVAPTGDIRVDGKGFGHGRGMSQYGAQGQALAGRSATQILDFYYPGTTTTTSRAAVRVLITADTTASLRVLAAAGLQVHDLKTVRTYSLPSATFYQQWELRGHGTGGTQLWAYSDRTGWKLYRSMTGMAQFQGPAVTKLVLPSGASRPYRGALRTADRGGADLDTLNVIAVDDYVRGVVPKEAIPSWRPAALQAQAIAARTYAMSRRTISRDYDLCDTVYCQVYGGYAAELAATNNAVVATANKIRTYAGKPILAEFSSSNGGYTAKGDNTYMPVKADPYDAYAGNGNGNASWTTTLSRSRLQSALGVGTVKTITVTKRNGSGTWGGRVVSAQIRGTAGTRTFTSDQLQLTLRLKSSWVRFDDSPIGKRWKAIGAAASPVGTPSGFEWPVRGGVGQAYRKGYLYWSASNGAWETYGSVQTRYRQLGGPNSALGIPIGAWSAGARPGSVVQRFKGGRIFTSAATGTREVTGRIYTAYYAAGLEKGRLGLPRSYRVPFTSGGGYRQFFQGGYVNWSTTSNRTAVVFAR